MFQQTHLVSNLTLFENVVVAGYVSGGRKAKEVQDSARELLDKMHVEDAVTRFPEMVKHFCNTNTEKISLYYEYLFQTE